jgi:hypothetical protein
LSRINFEVRKKDFEVRKKVASEFEIMLFAPPAMDRRSARKALRALLLNDWTAVANAPCHFRSVHHRQCTCLPGFAVIPSAPGCR